MKVRPAGLLLQFGLMPPVFTGLTILAGFAVGALVVAKLAPESQPVATVNESHRVVVLDGAAKYPAPTETMSAQAPEPLAVAQSWAFESTQDTSGHAMSKKRPDLLSAPEGWTYEAGAGTARE